MKESVCPQENAVLQPHQAQWYLSDFWQLQGRTGVSGWECVGWEGGNRYKIRSFEEIGHWTLLRFQCLVKDSF